jgi:hypothetical protein
MPPKLTPANGKPKIRRVVIEQMVCPGGCGRLGELHRIGCAFADPPRRDDGRCARHGCKKRLQQITDRHRRYGGDALLLESFCSTECCKRHYHVTIQGQEERK